MLEDTALGWYGFHGTVYINLGIAEDPLLLVTVLNHEDTHRTLSATTSHGLLQETLEFTQGENLDDSGRTGELRSILFEASRFVQEATATYCGLIYLDPAQRAGELSRMPPIYVAGFQALDGLLARHQLEPLEGLRLARAFGCRAMQTSVLADWETRRLADPDNLRRYVGEPRNSPDRRFRFLVDHFGGRTKDELAAFSGGHILAGDTRTLVPASQPAIGDIEFSEIPALAAVQARAKEIVDELCPGMFSGELGNRILTTLGHVGISDVSLQPATFQVESPPADEEWLASADLVQITRNVLDTPLRYDSVHGEVRIGPQQAIFQLRRPEKTSALQYTVSADRLGSFLADIDPPGKKVVCLTGITTWFPTPSEFEASGERLPDSFRSWTDPRPTLLYTASLRLTLISYCNLLSDSGDELIIHPVQAGRTWGLILIRNSAQLWPMIVHPTLISEWNNIQDRMLAMFTFRTNQAPAVFFGEDKKASLAILSFQRAYQGMAMPAGQWLEVSSGLAESLLADAGQPVDPRVYGVAYRDNI